jgi:hypothetical protein
MFIETIKFNEVFGSQGYCSYYIYRYIYMCVYVYVNMYMCVWKSIVWSSTGAFYEICIYYCWPLDAQIGLWDDVATPWEQGQFWSWLCPKMACRLERFEDHGWDILHFVFLPMLIWIASIHWCRHVCVFSMWPSISVNSILLSWPKRVHVRIWWNDVRCNNFDLISWICSLTFE